MPAILLNPLFVFTVTLFLSAFMLFWVELFVGKMILPTFGGTPAVWVTCMFFFQVVLLGGYTYAHELTTRLGLRKQLIVNLVMIATPILWFIFLPLGIYRGFDPPGESFPALWVILLLTVLVGLPFFVVSTSAPLLQKWFGQTGHPAAKDPYFLYAASNLGSMLGLNGYIVAIEPLFTLKMQGIVWMIGFVGLAALTVLGAYLVRRGPVYAALERAGELDVAPGSAAPPSSEQIKPASVDTITEKPPADGPSEPPPTEKPSEGSAGEGNGSPAAENEDEPVEQVADKTTASALKGAKRWRKKDKPKPAPSETGITQRPAEKVSPKAFPTAAAAELAPPPTVFDQVRWILLAFVPSSLMLGATTFITTDIAAVPLFWTIPLDLYLLSFILVFSRLPKWVHQGMVLSLPVAVLLLVFTIISEIGIASFGGVPGIVWRFVLHLGTLFIVAMVCHGELAHNRPATRYLTGFYLCMSFGGVLGGMFNALVAPVIFNSVAEYSLVLAVACMFLPVPDVDTKTKLNRYIDNSLAAGLGAAGIYVLIRILIRAFQVDNFADVASYLRLPGVNPGVINVVIAAALLLALIGYVAYRRQQWKVRLLDVFLPLSLFLLSAYLFVLYGIDGGPFATWNFGWLSNIFKVSDARIVLVFTYGLPIALCYGFAEQPLRFGLGVGAILLASGVAGNQGLTLDPNGVHYKKNLHQERSFFGVLKVEEDGVRDGEKFIPTYNRLLHGTTLHGMQAIGSDEPLTYYHRTGPVGHAYEALLSGTHAKDPVAFIGLGTGTMASYIKPEQTGTFYEIDRAVIAISDRHGDDAFFTYLKNCRDRKGIYEFNIGDARLKMRDAPDKSYRLIVVDAFSSDAIPVHLITKEAVEMYIKKLTDDGVACIHISNRYLDLGPVLGNIADDLKLEAIQLYDQYDPEQYRDGSRNMARMFDGKNSSDWVMVAKKKETLDRIRWYDRMNTVQGLLEYPKVLEQVGYSERAKKAWTSQAVQEVNVLSAMVNPNSLQLFIDESRWTNLPPSPHQAMWTDDFSNILSIFRWR